MQGIDTVRFLAHRDTLITALAFNPTLPMLASGDADGMVCLWDTATGAALGVFQGVIGNAFSIGGLTFSPDGVLLAAGPVDKNDTLTIWKVQPRTILAQAPAKNVSCLAFSPNGQLLACAQESLVLRDAFTLEMIRDLAHPPWPLSVGWHPDGKWLVSGGEEGEASVRIWNPLTWNQQAVFKPEHYSQNVRGVAFFTDDAVIFVNDTEQPHIWYWKSDEQPYPIPYGLRIPTDYPTVISPDGHHAASIDHDDYSVLHTVNLATGETTSLQSSHGHDEVIITATFSLDGHQVATADFDGFICIWPLTS